jgi:peptide/nickel transport system substrate-binding protein/oligopeptide transport system substrate-binding protein
MNTINFFRYTTVLRILTAALLLCTLLPGGLLAEEEEENAGEEFVVCFSSTTITFDPLHSFTATEAQLYTALYEGLVSYHPLSLNPIPAVASDWDISRDQKTYRFYLRKDARYWNGDHVKAQHFRDSWLKLIDPEVKAEYSFLLDVIKGAEAYRMGENEDPSSVGIRVISDYVLEVELEHPASHFLKVLCHHSFVPIHPKMLDKENWDQYSSVLGNGPYYIVNKKENEYILKRNELYWDKNNVEIPTLKVLFLDDPEEITERFNKGEIHWAADGMLLEQVNKRNAIIFNRLFATSYFYFYCGNEPWSNPKVREGLTRMLPWEEIRSDQYMLIPATNLIPSIPDYPEVTGINTQEIEKGVQLIEEAGYTEDNPLPEIVLTIPDSPDSKRIAGLMKSTWEEHLEVSVTIKTNEYPEYYNELKQPGYTLGTITWIGDFPDPLTFLQMWTGGSNLNDARFSSEEFDSIIRESMTQTGKTRYQTLAEAEEVLLQHGVVLPISHSPAFNLVDLTYVEGWFPNPLDIHPFKYLRFARPNLGPGIVLDQ